MQQQLEEEVETDVTMLDHAYVETGYKVGNVVITLDNT